MPAVLHAAVLETRNYIVGEANAPSGLHRYAREGRWTHHGWPNVRCFGLAASDDGTVLYLACGNGVLRSSDAGATWRVTTDWRITEVLDVALDPHRSGVVYAATAHGVWRSSDGGGAWAAYNDGLSAPSTTFAQVIAADRATPGRWVIGTEDGLFVSEGDGWTALGPRVPIRVLCQHETAPDVWLAGTEDHGVLLSSDGGRSWTLAQGPVADATLYAVAVAPHDPRLMAAGGYQNVLLVSTDGGAHWSRRPLDGPSRAIHALAFDPGRLWIGTVGAGVYVADGIGDAGATCRAAGLPEATVYRLRFLEVAAV